MNKRFTTSVYLLEETRTRIEEILAKENAVRETKAERPLSVGGLIDLLVLKEHKEKIK